MTGTLGATATAGGITDSGELNVSGAATFTSATGTDIILDTAANTFGGTVDFVGSGGNLNNVRL